MKAHKRLKKVRKALKLTQEELGSSISLGRITITNLESGKVKITTLHALALECKHGINHKWLLEGVGEMLLKNKSVWEATESTDMDGFAPTFVHTKKDNSISPSRSISASIQKVVAILESKTVYSEALNANIEAFYESAKAEQRINDMARRFDELEDNLEQKLEKKFKSHLEGLEAEVKKLREENKDLKKNLDDLDDPPDVDEGTMAAS